MQLQELKYWLSHPEEVNSEQVILLQQLSATYPAFTALQVCLWRVYKHNKHLLLDAQQRKVLALAPEELFLWEDVLAIGNPVAQVEPALSQETVVHQEVELEQDIQPESEQVIVQEIEENVAIESESTIQPEPEEVITQEVEGTEAKWLEPIFQPEPEQVIAQEIEEPIAIEPEPTVEPEPEQVIVQEIEDPEAIEREPEEVIALEDEETHPVDIEAVNRIEFELTENEGNTDSLIPEAEAQNQPEIEREVEEIYGKIPTPASTTHHQVVEAGAISGGKTLAEATNNSLSEEPKGNSPEMTFSQWMLWIQERKSQPVAQPTTTAEEELQATDAVPEQPIQTNDPLEKLYLEHMNAEYLKLEETAGPSLQQEALERVKKAESGEKNSFNLQKIAKDSLDENLIPVSETLAKIYESQEEWKRALTVYEKLLLQFPDKTLLFAAKIQELKNKI